MEGEGDVDGAGDVVFAVFEFGFGESGAGRGGVEGWSVMCDDQACVCGVSGCDRMAGKIFEREERGNEQRTFPDHIPHDLQLSLLIRPIHRPIRLLKVSHHRKALELLRLHLDARLCLFSRCASDFLRSEGGGGFAECAEGFELERETVRVVTGGVAVERERVRCGRGAKRGEKNRDGLHSVTLNKLRTVDQVLGDLV